MKKQSRLSRLSRLKQWLRSEEAANELLIGSIAVLHLAGFAVVYMAGTAA